MCSKENVTPLFPTDVCLINLDHSFYHVLIINIDFGFTMWELGTEYEMKYVFSKQLRQSSLPIYSECSALKRVSSRWVLLITWH